MKKRCLGLALALVFAVVLGQTALAESYTGTAGWTVAFTPQKTMDSNFRTADLDEAVSGLQPGDDIVFTVALENQYQETTDWWMTNEVLYSLEDRSANGATGGGAYTYVLSYTDKNGLTTDLFSSDTVGGDTVSPGGEGLHQATNALEDYFYLDTLTQGQSGYITLSIALDGETQGNDYQDTLADLQMNFAVELATQNGKPVDPNSRSLIRTGDTTPIWPYAAGLAVGLVVLVVAVVRLRREEKEDDRHDSMD
jgi:hypothetical protein